MAPLPGTACTLALLSYRGDARRLVTALKYRNQRAAVVPLLGAALGELVRPLAASMVTWAPTSARRRRARGFDQSELLARAVGRNLGLPVGPLLRRAPGPPQTGRSRADRQVGPAFTLRPAARTGPGLMGDRVLLVDDVITSGSTLVAAATALGEAGVTVFALAAAHTPSHVSAHTPTPRPRCAVYDPSKGPRAGG